MPVSNPVFKLDNKSKKCLSCGKTGHARKTCNFYNAICHSCNKRGHISSVCMSIPHPQLSNPTIKAKTIHCLNEENPKEEGDNIDIPCLHIYKCDESNTNHPIMIKVNVEGTPIDMELDTGSSISVIPLSTFESSCKHLKLQPTKLRTYGDETIIPVGTVTANVSHNGECHKAQMYVVDGSRVALFGSSWLQLFKLDWPSINMIQANAKHRELTNLIEKHHNVFSDKLGCLKGYSAQLHVRDRATPVHQKHRTVPFAIRSEVLAELDKLEKEGILSPVPNSEWATPVVPVIKKSGSVPPCGDFKVTINPELIVDTYPLPTIDDLQEKMNGGTLFSKLDLTKAYSQISLYDSSKHYATLTTHRGLYTYNRLPFGIASSAAIFQRQMDRIFKDLPNVLCYQDGILVTGKNREEHLKNLAEVLQRLELNGLTVRREYQKFLKRVNLTLCFGRIPTLKDFSCIVTS